MLSRLLEVLLPLFLEIFVHHALKRALIDVDPASLVLERLREQLGQLFSFMATSGLGLSRFPAVQEANRASGRSA